MTPDLMISLLTLLVITLGGLLAVVWRQISSLSDRLASASDRLHAHEVFVAQEYVTKPEHDRRIEQEISSIKEMILRVEGNLQKLLEQGQKIGSVA